jgi:hypothetical protein
MLYPYMFTLENDNFEPQELLLFSQTEMTQEEFNSLVIQKIKETWREMFNETGVPETNLENISKIVAKKMLDDGFQQLEFPNFIFNISTNIFGDIQEIDDDSTRLIKKEFEPIKEEISE